MAIPFPEINPVALAIGPIWGVGIIEVRWYALAYLAGFIVGAYYCGKLAQRNTGQRPDKNDIDDYLTWAVLGVILGGRLGYVLFYQLQNYLQNPSEILMVWHGGMSFHGGLLGVATSMLFFSKFKKINVFALSDLVSAAAPIGLFFGRLANFANAELYGRITTVPWAMVFPNSDGYARHPSQLYEAASEGLVLFLILFIAIFKFDMLRHRGFITGAFLFFYGLFRGCIEFVREPDEYLGLFGGIISMGQILCLPMIFSGMILMYISLKKKNDAAVTENH